MARLSEALRPFSKATIAKATYRQNPKEVTRQFVVTFANPENVAAVESALQSASVGTVFFVDDWTSTTGVPNDRVFEPRLSTEYLYKTGNNDDYYHHAYNSRTRAWGLFSIKAPMAWEISRGSSDVAIGIVDNFTTCSPSPVTTDVSERTTANGTGNVRRIVSTITSAYTGLPVNTGNGVNKSTYPIKTGHGYSVLGAVISKSDNDPHNTPAQGPSGSAVGTCPECSGVLFPLNPPDATLLSDPCLTPSPNAIDGVRDVSLSYDFDMLDDFDLDFTNDASGKMKRLDVLNCSYVGGNGILHRRLLRNGVAIVAAAGNDWGVAPFDPAATLVMDPQASKDTKILAVGSISDGELLGSDCAPWGIPQVMAPIWKGAERFTEKFVFSPENKKFSLEKMKQRESSKRGSYMDVVAPGGNVWTLSESTGQPASQNGYSFLSGTSISTALVSGVVGMMFSINPNMGVEMDAITDLPAAGADGLDVQRRMYNIVTFTADKVEDQDRTYSFALQANDDLRRSWSQRMGFGKVNAYRAVAHSITLKGDYEYAASSTLDFSAEVINSNNIRLMHWGSRIKDGVDWPLTALRGGTAADDGIVDVVKYGGRSLPGESHNNQGVTRLTSTVAAISITVPDSSTLCIDGMLLNEGSEFTHKVIATESNATILAEGLVRNVELEGQLKIGDLVVDGNEADPALHFSRAGDVYGVVKLQQRAGFVVSDTFGSCRLRPGSHVSLEGINDLVVRNGGELVLDHASRISRTAAQEVDVNTGATMRVMAGVKTSVDVRVRVRAGSQFIIEDSAVVFLRDLVVESGGTFIVNPGAHVAFGDSVIDINGHMEIVGGTTADKRITLTTEIAENCVFDARDHARMSTRTRIRAVGSTPDWQNSSVSIQYADLKNIGVQLTNIVSEPIYNCAFSMHRDLPSYGATPQWSADSYMLEATTSIRPTDAPESYNYLAVINSSFIDSAQAIPIAAYQAPYRQSMKRYVSSGVSGTNLVRLDVTGCSFSFLHEGVVSSGSAYCTVNASAFTDMDFGVRALYGQPRVCSSTFTTVEYPATLYNADRAYHSDNMFVGSRVAVRLEDCAMQAFRNNDFDDYWKGIEVNNAVASLTSLREDVAPFELEMFGRNRFDVTDPVPFTNAPANHPNPFMRRNDPALYATDVAMLSDLSADGAGGLFLVRCGQNRFGAFTTSHVAYLHPTQLEIDFSINNCRPYAMVRTLNVGAVGAPLNVEGITDPMCGPQIDEDNCSSEIWRDGRNEIPGGESLKRRMNYAAASADSEFEQSPTVKLAINIEDSSNLRQILQSVLKDFLASDSFVVRGLIGQQTLTTCGTYIVDILRDGMLTQRVVLLVTP
ncbi:MAG: S8 family serine peptidase [Candidatus Kapabacteria bacterium]|nr:S8 family serine peptidase [Candidatus Kapabacteria bacterium]